MSPNDFTFLIH